MKTTNTFLSTAIAAAALTILGISCSDLKKNLPTAVVIQKTVHPAGWTDTASTSFHGRILLQQLTVDSTAEAQCNKCHGVTVRKTCADCHGTVYPHSMSWKSGTFNPATDTAHHAYYLKNHAWNVGQCVSCHGSDFKGGSSGKSCYRCHTSYPHIASVWNDTLNAQFHGQRVKAQNWNAAECQACHGTDFAGGFSGQSCFACHVSYPHAAAWKDTLSVAGFHGVYLKNKSFALTECQPCHGSTYQGGTSGSACYTCHASYPHLTSWRVVSSGVSHGQYLKTKTWNSVECQSCHGADYRGGTSSQACFTCHSTYPHPSNVGSAHPGILQTAGYPLARCQTCHGTTYTGGTIANVTCERSGCHQDASNTPKSPETCNSCHGQFRAAAASTLTYAPPEDVVGDTAVTVTAVGAHQKHLVTNTVGATVACAECHTVPATTFAVGHLNAAGQAIRAEVLFNGSLAKHPTAVTPNPAYDLATNKCSDTYCHGNWRLRASAALPSHSFIYTDSVMVGANFSPKWNGGSAEAACGTCHGMPPAGHDDSDTNCGDCHSTVVDAADNHKIIDKTKHINGQVDVDF